MPHVHSLIYQRPHMTAETPHLQESIHLTREELYEQVWTTPLVQLAKQYGISDVGLAKICKRLNIPHPGLGYWAKQQHGKSVRKTALPPAKMGTPATIVIRRAPEPPPPEPPSPVDPLMEAEYLPENRVTVAPTLHGPHPLLKPTAAALRGDKYPDQYGRVYAGRRNFNIQVGKQSVDRVLRLLNALLKACDHRGYNYHEPEPKPWEKATHIRIVVLGHPLAFRISERATQTDLPAAKDDRFASRVHYTPNGRLRLQLDGYYSSYNRRLRQVWEDQAGHPIEERLNDFLASLIGAARIEEQKK